MRYAVAFIVALLLCAGIAVFFYEHFIAAMSIVLILSFRRFVFWVLWVLFVIPFMPEHWRHVLEHGFLKIRRWIVAVLEWVWLTWKHGHIERRAFMSVCGACACGGLAGVLIFSPGSITRIPLVGQWLSDTVMPYLMRTAAFKTVEANIPEAWKHVPEEVRPLIRRPFVRLWWKTARKGVLTRQMLGKHSPHRQ